MGNKDSKPQNENQDNTQMRNESSNRKPPSGGLKGTQYSKQLRKSSVRVENMKNVQIDEKLFEGKQKQRLNIQLIRTQPFDLIKDQDYFDSEMDDKEQLKKIQKVYKDCQIANYQTPQHQKLQTVQVKTYLFDRNLIKIK